MIGPLLNRLHNLRQGDIAVQYYIAKFENLTVHCDVREHCSHTVIRFVWGLRFKIRHSMINSSYDLDNIEGAFDIVLKQG